MTATLDQLRARIAQIEGVAPDLTTGAAGRQQIVPTGWAEIDAGLHWVGPRGNGLPAGAVHEVLSPDPDDGAATGFLLALARAFLAARPGGLLWASCRADLYGPGLLAAGLDPARVVIARGQTAEDVLWSVEEGLATPGLAAVAAETGPLDFSLSRRLQLAAHDHGRPLLLLCPARRSLWPSAAVTRWQAAAAPGGRRAVELLRCRAGRPGRWVVSAAPAPSGRLAGERKAKF